MQTNVIAHGIFAGERRCGFRQHERNVDDVEDREDERHDEHGALREGAEDVTARDWADAKRQAKGGKGEAVGRRARARIHRVGDVGERQGERGGESPSERLRSDVNPEAVRKCQHADGQAGANHSEAEHRPPPFAVAQPPDQWAEVEREQALGRLEDSDHRVGGRPERTEEQVRQHALGQ